MRVRRETERPRATKSISYSQISAALTCGLRLKFQRSGVKQRGIGIMLLYGRALHAGIDARAKGRARSSEEACLVAIHALRTDVRQQSQPVLWDEMWETLKDGSPSAESYGNLWGLDVCEWWLRQQVPLYVERYPDLQIRRSEHRIFVPLTPPPGVEWKDNWALECWLDREMADGSIHDLKSANKAWDESTLRKQAIQAQLYMAAYSHFYERRPAHFEFHVLPRVKGVTDKGELRAEPLVQVFRVEWSTELIQRYIDSIVKPQVTAIENGTYVANPGGALCSRKFCGYHSTCAFGSGDQL